MGRTPLTLDQTQPGHYQVRVIDPGFERWDRSLMVDGTKSDTVWMSLQAKTRGRAAFRSLVVPGWGQFYSRRAATGWGYLAANLGALGATVIANRRYDERRDDLRAAKTTEEWQERARQADHAGNVRDLVGGATIGLWVLSAIDAAALFPHFERERIAIEIDPHSIRGSTKSARMAITIEF
jgi:hypothetical protein